LSEAEEHGVLGPAGLMRFRILGPLEVLSADGWTAIGAPKWRSLLACLLVRSEQLVPTDLLIDELWGDTPPSTANNLVSIYVHRLRKVIGDGEGKVLIYRDPGYLLRLEPGDLDLREFESRFAAGRDALAADDLKTAAELLSAALSLWRGPLLADVTPSPLITLHTDRVAELWLAATELRIEADLACDRAAQVVPELRGLVQDHPMRERLWLLLMRALEDEGRRAEAFEVFAQAREVISAELGVDPGAELQQFYRELLAADMAAAPVAPKRRTRPRAPLPSPSDAGGLPVAARGDSARVPDTVPAEVPDAVLESPGAIAIGTFAGSADSVPGAERPAEATVAAESLPSARSSSARSSSALVRPTQLPADIGDFTGRGLHVSHLCELLLTVNESSPGAVRIAVVNGAAGLGKTTLAVHAAHQVSAQFPDGQLYVDLLGASAQPAEPGEVLARFLRDLGVEGDKVPARDDERAALYRTALTGRRMLILLDNAKDAAQVRQLLPGSSSCAVLVTTRNRTADLAGTRLFDLNVLEDTEALALFSRIAGEERAAAEPDATAEVLVACAGLPLAIRICAARLAARRGWKIATLASRLRDASRRLDEMETGDLAVRASFQVSYDSLRRDRKGTDPARAFRLLGLWQGTTISLPAATALIGEPEDDVAGVLEALVDVNLLESPSADRYRFHDLLRVYATERAASQESELAREEAVARLLGWYLGTAEAAANVVSPQRYRVPREATADASPLVFASMEEALAWYADERANVISATRQAAAVGLHDVAWQLPPTMFPLFGRWSNWADCVTSHRVGLESAHRMGNRAGEAWVLNQLGYALMRLLDPEAFEHLEQALAIRRELADIRGEAQTAIALGEGYFKLHGPGADALRHMRRAVDLLRSGGATSLRAVALNNLGEIYLELGDLGAAEECYIEARDICREMGGGYVEGHALHNLGRIYQLLHRTDEAVSSYGDALRKHRASGVLSGVATTLKHLGEVYVEIGDPGRARTSLAEALRVFEQIGDQAEAAETSGLLESLAASY
jgi:DNA-binding SARP family transcriptional activator/tetratricopeptide (TPR) repeat protein